MDYFNWAMVQGEGKYADEIGDECPLECGLDDQVDMCCTTISMYPENSRKAVKQHSCMKAEVSEMSSGIWIDDYYYEYECRRGDWKTGKRVRSGASTLAAGAASVALVLSMI